MKYYVSYMDRQEISPEVHERLLHLEPSRRRASRQWARYTSLAACAALILGVGAWRLALSPAPSYSADEDWSSAAQAADPEGGNTLFFEAQDPAALQNTLAQGSDTERISTQKGAADFQGFVADSGETGKMAFPAIPYVAYPDTTNAPQIAADIAFPEGSFSVDLSQKDIELLLWGSEERLEKAHFKEKPGNVPWMLFWDGFTLSGRAMYDGQGDLWQASLWGYRGDERFDIIMAPGHLPPTCIVQEGSTVSDVRGVKVEGWSSYYDSDGDGVKEYRRESAFLAHDIGVRATFVSPKKNSDLSDLFINWSTYPNDGLTLDHLRKAGHVPAWRSETFTALEQARQEVEFAPYLPAKEPEGYSSYFGNKEFYGHLSYQEGTSNMLFVRWSRGYDNVEVVVWRDGGPSLHLVDPSEPEAYDLRLYPIPWCDSVPRERWDTVNDPTFRAEDMSLAVVEARGREHDTGGMTYSFDVLHPDGTLVSYRCDGMTAQQVWEMVKETL